MIDRILESFLQQQGVLVQAFCDGSSRLHCELIQTDESLPPNLFLIRLTCQHTLFEGDEIIVSDEPCTFAIHMPEDYLRRPNPNPGRILSLIEPRMCAHPNMQWPFICAGSIAPGTDAVDLILRVHDLLTYNQFTPREDDALNQQACRWAREHMKDFPLETRPLRDLQLSAITHEPENTDFTLEAAK
ncbi:MAG: hypothetical protein O3A63_22010 [Proteobacteria bacterium]|nr:hypothetical protein [Pseudomonadota bacterium]